MHNPIDKDKTTDIPGTISYPHHVGSVVIRPEDEGKLKSRALSAMREQTGRQLLQIQKQAELLAEQAKAIRKRIELSERIYSANMSFEPFIGQTYHLYKSGDIYKLLLIEPEEWGPSGSRGLEYICSAVLLSDHTWDILNDH
ncbi:MAG: DUF2452 domain-containing protein [Bacteroidetes bacterium]|nr:DUF2452 domain-containing protein [Bacteroidota bacterium]